MAMTSSTIIAVAWTLGLLGTALVLFGVLTGGPGLTAWGGIVIVAGAAAWQTVRRREGRCSH